nr:chitobiase/beta-hexosaminidase C-terminal domain-containing protein [Verrucomicrobiota bacterium]
MPIVKTPGLFCRLLCCYFSAYLALPYGVLAQTPFYLTPPSFPSTNTVRVTVADTPTNVAVTVYSTPLLSSNPAWTAVTTGAVGQTVFDLARTTNASSFYRASHEAPGQTLTVATPGLTPGGGSYPLPTNVVITCATEGAAIFFTTNGATPTTADTYLANGDSVSLTCSVTLKARAFKSGFTDSDVASATYTINCPPV